MPEDQVPAPGGHVQADLSSREPDLTTNIGEPKRLQRIDKSMSGEAREMFKAFVPDGDLAKFARGLPGAARRLR